MTYKINGVKILQPTSGAWSPRRPDDISGEGRPIYPGVYQFRLQWQLMPMADFDTIHSAWLAASATGTVTVDLPDPDDSSYQFRTFSGCFVEEPQMGAYFQEHITNVILILTHIQVR